MVMDYSAIHFNILCEMRDFLNCEGLCGDASYVSVTFMYFYCKSLCILIIVYIFLLFVHVFSTLSMYSYYCLCILIVRPCILNVVYVFLLLSMHSYYCLCILIVRPCILNVVYVFLLLSMYS